MEWKEKEFDILNQKYFDLQIDYDNIDKYKNQLVFYILYKYIFKFKRI